jgi:hypothetical protein
MAQQGEQLIMKESRIQNISLFLLSIGLIAFELYVLRVFSVGNWSNFGSMVISIALLGFGFAGTLLTFLQKSVRANPQGWLRWSAIGLVPAMALSFIMAQQVPFNPVLIVSESVQFFWIGVYYLLYAIPFFFGAMFIGVAFTVISDRIHKLYFWNMAGSGLGGVILLGLMYVLPVRYLVYPVILITMSGVMLVLFEMDGKGRLSFDRKRGRWAVGLFVASLLALGIFGDIKVSRFKSTELAKVTFSDLKEVHSEYSPFGEMVVYHSSQFHFAPGLSDNAIFHIKEMPRDAYWGLYIDGNGPINIMRELKGEETTYIDYLPLSAAYQIVDDPEVLLLRLGGGFGAFTALYHDAKHVTVVEPNTALVNMMGNVPAINEFNNNLLKNPRLDVVVNEPRAFCETTDKKFDLVEISLIDSVGLSQSVGNPLDENYIYTVEAFKDYMNSLTPDGLLSVTVWNHLAPPRNVPRLLATVATSLKNQGIAEPSRHIYVFHLIYSTATILVKNSPFTEAEIKS